MTQAVETLRAIVDPEPADKMSTAWHDWTWRQWTRTGVPKLLNAYEAAAYLRVNYHTITRACRKGKDGRARLQHQRLGSAYRIQAADLNRFGLVEQRAVH